MSVWLLEKAWPLLRAHWQAVGVVALLAWSGWTVDRAIVNKTRAEDAAIALEATVKTQEATIKRLTDSYEAAKKAVKHDTLFIPKNLPPVLKHDTLVVKGDTVVAIPLVEATDLENLRETAPQLISDCSAALTLADSTIAAVRAERDSLKAVKVPEQPHQSKLKAAAKAVGWIAVGFLAAHIRR